MSDSPSKLKRLLKDPLYFRVCHVIFALPFLALGIVAVLFFPPTNLKLLLGMLVCAAFSIWGGWLMYVAIRGSDAELENSTKGFDDGGQLLGLAIVIGALLFALPITALIRYLKPQVK